MRKSILALALASTADAWRVRQQSARSRRMRRSAAVGGAAVGAVVPGVSVIEGAAVGAAIGGLAGAVWSDNNNDGYVDGYVYNGQYYAGTPQGYDPTHCIAASRPARSAARRSARPPARSFRASASSRAR